MEWTCAHVGGCGDTTSAGHEARKPTAAQAKTHVRFLKPLSGDGHTSLNPTRTSARYEMEEAAGRQPSGRPHGQLPVSTKPPSVWAVEEGLRYRVEMRIHFEVGSDKFTFERNNAIGTATLRAGDECVELQSPWSLSTHFSLGTTKAWNAKLLGHDITITQTRPRLLGGMRTMQYEVRANGQVVARHP